ncbi:MAG: histidinol-phosphate transaminase [Prevotella sp.]|nr:histidinol-phosphate transaminase [Prevotella sp.]
MKNLDELVRKNILQLTPYSCARNEFSDVAKVFLDANESPYNAPLNRYPDPLQREVKRAVAAVKNVNEDCIFLGNGSDEAIDLVFRIFCEPAADNVVAFKPTYGMYEVCAGINNIEYRAASLNADFTLSAERLLALADSRTKAVFLCTPNNPTGNSLDFGEVKKVLDSFAGITVIDEAYGDFSEQKSYRELLPKYPNLIVLNTMSKAWASAGIRLGMAFAAKEIIALMNNVKYPYNISLPSQREALSQLRRKERVDQWIKMILSERQRVVSEFSRLDICRKIFPTDANFFLVRVSDARAIYLYLLGCGIVVRDRSRVELCDNALRITIGTREENDALLNALRQYAK